MCVCKCVCVCLCLCAYSLLTACGKCFSQRSVLKNVRLANKAVRKSWKLTSAGRRAGNQCRHFVKELPTSSKSWFSIHILTLPPTSTSTFTFTFGAACLIRHTKLVLQQQQQKAQGDIFSFFPSATAPFVCTPYYSPVLPTHHRISFRHVSGLGGLVDDWAMALNFATTALNFLVVA